MAVVLLHCAGHKMHMCEVIKAPLVSYVKVVISLQLFVLGHQSHANAPTEPPKLTLTDQVEGRK